MNGAYQIINFDDIEFTTGTAELVVGAYKKITDTAKRFVITHLNLDDEVYKDIQLTFENVEGTFVGTGVVNGKLAVVSIASTDQVTVSLNDIAGGITALQNALAVTDAKFNYSTTEKVVGTWVDGKPLYRKAYTGTFTGLEAGVRTTILLDTNESIDVVVSASGYAKFGSGNSVLPYHYYAGENDQQHFSCNYQSSTGNLNLVVYTNNVVYNNNDYCVVVEYTKTTDTPPTP